MVVKNKVIATAVPEFKISVKNKRRAAEKVIIRRSEDIYSLAKRIFSADTIDWIECAVIICLNHSNQVLGFYKISSGGITGTVVDPRVVLQIALLSNATGLILIHNHPSGSTEFSRADVKVSERLKEAAQLFDIRLVDSLVITSDGYASMINQGLI